jgi:hypothetical protein
MKICLSCILVLFLVRVLLEYLVAYKILYKYKNDIKYYVHSECISV